MKEKYLYHEILWNHMWYMSKEKQKVIPIMLKHYSDVIMATIASQITSLTIVYATVYTGPDQRKHQSSVSLVFVRGIHRGPVNSPHKGPVTRKKFPFDDVIMITDQWMGCHSQELPCAPLAAGAELPSVRTLLPVPLSARLLAVR